MERQKANSINYATTVVIYLCVPYLCIIVLFVISCLVRPGGQVVWVFALLIHGSLVMGSSPTLADEQRPFFIYFCLPPLPPIHPAVYGYLA